MSQVTQTAVIKILKNHIEFQKKSKQFLSTNEQRVKELGFDGKFLSDSYLYGFGANIESIISFWSDPLNFRNCRIVYVEEQNTEINSFIWWVKSYNEKILKIGKKKYFKIIVN